MEELQYIRTDRNGTKYYYDWNCPRCGGAGSSDKWSFTGRICYACGGTGKRAKPVIVKEYTDEYAATLAAKRKAREDSKPKPDEEEVRAELERAKARSAKREGINADGTGYAYEGNTFPIRNDIKRLGGRWNFGLWIAPTLMEVPEDVTVTKISAVFVDGGWNVYKGLKAAGIY